MSNGPTKDEQARGGAEYIAVMQDGTQEEFVIRQIKLKNYRKASAVWGDEFAMVALYCDKPQSWVENLSPESYEHIATEGARINQPFFGYCARTEAAVMQRARVLAPDRLNSILDSALPTPTSSLIGRRTPLPTPESP